MLTRYGSQVVLPDVTQHEGEHLVFMERIGRELPIKGVIIPTNDAYLLFVSQNRSFLSQYFDFVLPEHHTVETIANKKLQYQYATSVGIPIPRTFLLNCPGDIERIADCATYPCIIKPVYSHLWRKYLDKNSHPGWGKVVVAQSSSELIQLYSQMAESGIDLVVQEQIDGGDDRLYGLLTYHSRASEPLAVFTKRKFRQWPMDYGTGSFQISAFEPKVMELGLRLLAAIDYQGLATIEFKNDPEDGVFKLIEINPRSAISQQIAVDSGVDIPYIAYQDIRGEPVEEVKFFRSGVKWIHLGFDIKSFLQYRGKKRLSFFSWLNSIKGVRSHAYFAWDDPVPFLLVTLALAKEAVWGLWKRSGRSGE